MNKKKVLITIDWFDPAYKAGGPVISIIKLVENLHDRYDFWILCGARDYSDREDLEGVTLNEWMDWRGMAQVYYLSSENKTRKKIFDLLDNSGADIYYVQGIFSLYFSIYPLVWWHQAKEEKMIVATRGMFHASALNVKKAKKYFYLYTAKIMGWFHHITFHSTNPEETVQLKAILGREAEYLEASNFPRILPFSKQNYKKQKNTLKLLSVARISKEKNTHFLLTCLAQCTENIKITLIGTYNDEAYFEEFMNLVKSLPPNVELEYLGHKKVADLPQYYESHDVFILPTTGENYGHAIVEALTSGLPCLISHNTPWNGLAVSKAGYNLDENTDFYVKAIKEYHGMGEEEYLKAADSARNYAMERIDIEEIRQSYYKMLE